MRRVLFLVVGVTVLSVFLVEVGTPPAAAATLFVDPGNLDCDDGTGSPYCSIQAAVNAASDGDTISLSAGTHIGASTYVVDMTLTTQKALTFQGAGIDETIIDGENSRPGFRFVDTAFEVRDLTILNGQSSGSGGGLILQNGAGASLFDVRIENANAVASGGAIYAFSGSALTLTDSVIVGNESGVNGGGLFGTGDVVFSITNSVIMNNTAGTDGGGISVETSTGTPTLTVDGSVLSDNLASNRGGAIYASLPSGDITITDSEIVDNDAGAGGGGGVFLVQGHHRIERVLFAGNDALGHGGGLHYGSSASASNSIEILNSTFSGNTAVGDGGGAYTNQVVANSTFVGNTATVRGGGVARTTSSFPVRNTIMADNSAPTSADCYGAISLGYNLTTSSSGSCFSSFDATNLVMQDPGLGPLADNGLPTRTHALTWESAARDAGNPGVPGSGGDACEAVDQLSVARGADRCDIGAVELAATGGVFGKVMAAGSGAPISGITVALYSEAGTPISTTVTSGTGSYGFSSVLTPGSYLVGFAADSATYTSQWWNAKSAMNDADPIGLPKGVGAVAVNAFLTGDTLTVGLFDPSQGQWHLRNGTGAVTSFYFGNPGDFPIMGDWDCDGVDTPGMYRQSDGFVYLRNTNTQGIADIRFFFGNPGDVPIAGDFNNDGCDTVSIYRPSNQTFYIINALGANDGGLGAADFSYVFGNPGDKPFVGDFNGNGTDTVGLHREATGFVYFRNTHTQGNADNQFFFGDPNDRFITGDWNANGTDTPGIFRPGNTTFYFRFTNTQGNADDQFIWGQSGWLPVSGNFGLG